MRVKFLAVLLFFFSTAAVLGNKIVVAKSGTAYSSVQSGVSAANAGDTVMVKAGIYNEVVSFTKSGSEINGYITLMGESGVILDGTGKGEIGISISGKNYIRVIGMEIRNFTGKGTPMGISVNGSSTNLEIRNNKVHNIENTTGNAHGIAFYGNNAAAISNILVDGNEINNCKLGQSESLVLNGNVTNFIVSNNLVHDNDNIGIDFIGFEGTCAATNLDQARDGICINNTVYNISSKTNPTYGGEQSADGIYVDGGRNIIIERNRVHNCDIGIELASEHKGKNTQDIVVRNNFISGSYQANIMAGGYDAQRGNAVNITIVNNTTVQGSAGELALQFNCNNIIVKNNLFYANSGQTYLQKWGSNNLNINVNNNMYYGGSSLSPGNWPDTNAKYLNPQLINGAANMHLSPTSPAINAGINLGKDNNGIAISGTLDIDNATRIVGDAIDIGADEYETPDKIDLNHDESTIVVYPNPAKNSLNISTSNNTKPSIITICNITGKEIVNQQFKNNETLIDITDLTSGTYLVKLIVDERTEIRKIIKE